MAQTASEEILAAMEAAARAGHTEELLSYQSQIDDINARYGVDIAFDDLLYDFIPTAIERGDTTMTMAILERAGWDREFVIHAFSMAAQLGLLELVIALYPRFQEILSLQYVERAFKLAAQGGHIDVAAHLLPLVQTKDIMFEAMAVAVRKGMTKWALKLFRHARDINDVSVMRVIWTRVGVIRDLDFLMQIIPSPEDPNIDTFRGIMSQKLSSSPRTLTLSDEERSVLFPVIGLDAAVAGLKFEVTHKKSDFMYDLAAYYPEAISLTANAIVDGHSLVFLATQTGALSKDPVDMFLWGVGIGSRSVVERYARMVDLNEIRDTALDVANMYSRPEMAAWIATL